LAHSLKKKKKKKEEEEEEEEGERCFSNWVIPNPT
jgi:hypothetical protein